jgi:hypothetical protein
MSVYGSGTGPEYLDPPEPRIGRGGVICWSCGERAVPLPGLSEDVTCRRCGADPCCPEDGEYLDGDGTCPTPEQHAPGVQP